MVKVLIVFSLLPSLILSQEKVSVTGAGATFVFPLLSNWAKTYAKNNPDVNVNYQSIGSGGGIRQFINKTVDFGASESPIPDDLLEKNPDALHIPVTVGGVVLGYNLPDIRDKRLKLTPDVVVDIFFGKIKKWNDESIQKLNPELSLPDKEIVVVHRSDGSGTTYVFVRYLSEISSEWKEKVGAATSVNWPVGIGAKGNEGVAGTIKNLRYSIGYIELAYAKLEKIPFALLENKSGNYIEASLQTLTNSVFIPDNLEKKRLFYELVNTPEKEGYPITGFSYILLWQDYKVKDCKKITNMIKFLKWTISKEGQDIAEKLEYARLPESIIKLNTEILDSITCNGKKLED
ncbi:MAG: phosphate ABC transporter substrate-binding protein PstS [Planctomycetota bacterium]